MQLTDESRESLLDFLKLRFSPTEDQASFDDILAIECMIVEDKNVRGLLHEFWQRSSEACPLTAIEAEKEEKEFEKFVLGYDPGERNEV